MKTAIGGRMVVTRGRSYQSVPRCWCMPRQCRAPSLAESAARIHRWRWAATWRHRPRRCWRHRRHLRALETACSCWLATPPGITRIHTHTHARLTALFPGLPKRQWVAVASAGPYASLYLAPDRQSHQYPTALFFTGRMPFLPPNQQRQSTEGNTDNEIRQHFLCVSNLVRPVVFYEKPATDAHAC